MIYSDHFFDVLGRWQKGWRRDPVMRGNVAAELVSEVARLPSYVREHDQSPVFRKRNLYRRKDQRELAPLFLNGLLDEGSPTSWSMSEKFAEEFGKVFDDSDPNSAAGAIFRHIPAREEVVLSIPRLWQDPAFVAAAKSYKQRGGTEAEAIFHFLGERDQFEVILRAPLQIDEIYRLARPTNYENLYAATGAETDESRYALDSMLSFSGIDPFDAKYLSPEATSRVVKLVVEKQKAKLAAWIKKRIPTRPHGRRARLCDAIYLGQNEAGPHASFVGWRRLRGRGGLLEGRWSDGTVVYYGLFGRVWLR